MNVPYVIAEMGVNFYDTARILRISPLKAAKRYIDAAADAGIQCVKFQSYKAATLASKHSPSYWDTTKEPAHSQYELFRRYDGFNAKDYAELSAYAHRRKMDFASTPFDYPSADYLFDFTDFYKISSSDLSNLPFIRYIGAKGKPVCLSVGASYLSETEEAVRTLKEAGCSDITLLHCVLSYPTQPQDANLLVIRTLKTVFPDLRIGFSDHVAPDEEMLTLSAAFLMGAEVIEKHFTLDKTLQGNDHYHAGDPKDFRKAMENFRRIVRLLGTPEKTVLECERIPRREARRSLVLTRDICAGEVIAPGDLAAKRPGTGIPPKNLEIVLGRRVKENLPEDTILTWDMV